MSLPDTFPTELQQPDPRFTSREEWQAEIAERRQIGEVALSNIQEPLTVGNFDDKDKVYAAVTNIVLASSKTKEEAVAMMEHIQAIQKTAFGDKPNIPPLVDPRPIVMADPKIQELINSRDLRASHKGLLEAWPHFQEAYIVGVKKGVEQGYIPKSVMNRLEAAFMKTSVRVADAAVLDTDGPIMAYYRNDNDEISVRHDLEQTGEGFLDSLTHELTHKVSGGTFKSTNSPGEDLENFNRPRVGFATEIKEEILRTGVNEAVTHHVTLGILTGNFETLDPDKREEMDNTYYGYRKLLAEFVDRSQGLIDVKTITNAFFEDSGPQGDIQERRKFIHEVRQAYGQGALTKLEKLMDLSDLVGSYRYEEVIFNRIHPPVLDNQGNVVKQGYIDTKSIPTNKDLSKELASNN